MNVLEAESMEIIREAVAASGMNPVTQAEGERAEIRRVRFCSLGCRPLTAAVASNADTLEAAIAETFNARDCERRGRPVDANVADSLEENQREDCF